MDSLLQQFLNNLRSSVSQMAGLVESSVYQATKSLAKKDVTLVENVFVNERKINQFHKDIDRMCFKLLARQSPVASDLRLILVSSRINVDLERMGDLACNICYCVRDYFEGQPLLVAGEIPKMSDLVRSMIKKSVNAFVNTDLELAREVLRLDDAVDQYRDMLNARVKEMIKENPENINSSLELMNIVRYFERLGDHSTNIAEEVIFLSTGEDIRHQSGDVGEENHDGDRNYESNPSR